MCILSPDDRKRRVGIICHHIVRNIAYHRATYKKLKNSHNNFWITINSNFLDVAVTDWCKLFADIKGHHSWRMVIPNNKDQIEFLENMLGYLKITEADFDEYIRSMRHYRDKFLSHLDDENIMNIPHLKSALKSTEFLFCYLYSDCNSQIYKYYKDEYKEAHFIIKKNI